MPAQLSEMSAEGQGQLFMGILDMIQQRNQQTALQNNPYYYGIMNNMIGAYNNQQASNPYQGFDQNMMQYANGQLGASQGNMNAITDAYSQFSLDNGLGAVKMPQLSFGAMPNFPAAPTGGQPGTPGTPPPAPVYTPQPLPMMTPPKPSFLDQVISPQYSPIRDWFGGIGDRMRQRREDRQERRDSGRGSDAQAMPSYAVGTTSVPQTGPALLHQGEMVLPRALNPMAKPAGVPGAPMRNPTGVQPLQTAAPAPIQPLPSPASSTMPIPQSPQMPPMPQAPAGTANFPTSVNNYNQQFQLPALPTEVGLSNGVVDQMKQQGYEQIDLQNQNAQRQMRENAAAGGQLQSGAFDRRMFDANLAANQQRSDYGRTLDIQAANQRFGDTMTLQNAALQRASVLGGLDQNQQSINLNRELGLGRLGLDTEMGRGNLALNTELGRGGLDLQNRQFGQSQQEWDDRFGLSQQQFHEGNRQFDLQQNLADRLGMGQLGLGQDQLAFGERQYDTNTRMGLIDRQMQAFLSMMGMNNQNMGNMANQANQATSNQNDNLAALLAMIGQMQGTGGGTGGLN